MGDEGLGAEGIAAHGRDSADALEVTILLLLAAHGLEEAHDLFKPWAQKLSRA